MLLVGEAILHDWKELVGCLLEVIRRHIFEEVCLIDLYILKVNLTNKVLNTQHFVYFCNVLARTLDQLARAGLTLFLSIISDDI